MGCRGVHFAIEPTVVERLIARDDGKVMAIIEEIEEEWDDTWCYETDKAWDAIHRCLTDGRLGWENGTFPLNHVILGGERLYEGDDYIVQLVRPEKVQAVASALKEIDKVFFREQYQRIDSQSYPDASEEDFDYTWGWFEGLPEFFQRAADAGRAVVFTSDQ